MEKPKEKPPEFFKSVKTSLKSILKHPEINSPKINDVVIKAHQIVIHTLQFLKLYMLHYYDTSRILPTMDKVLILNVMKIVCGEKHTNMGKPPKKETIELKEKLTNFYNKHYKPYTQTEQLDYEYMSNVLSYLCEDIQTMYENNIQLHYVDYVERFVNVVWKKKMIVEKIRIIFTTKKERETKIRKLESDLRKIKNDLLIVDTVALTSHSCYHKWITEQKKHILPNKEKFHKQSVYYDLKCSPMDYFPCMIAMMKEVENELETISNVFPLRSSIAPGYIRLDTITLVYLLLRKEQGKKCDYSNQGNTKKHEDKIWKFFFRTEKKVFHKNPYSFHHMISTDGVGVSVLFIRDDLVGKRLPNAKKGVSKEMYIDELNDYSALQNMKIVGIDPGKEDLIYCVDDASKHANVFRYSQNQRRKETKMKKYKNIMLGMKTKKIQGKSVIEYETELSVYNRKTLQIDKFKEYIGAKNRINKILFGFYEKHLFRKLKFGRHINSKRNEQKMISNFRKMYGNPEEVVICIGDWEQRKQMKYKEPTLGKGMRTLFRKNNYKVFLVDEFRTSCRCSRCEGICEKFMVRKNPKPKPKSKIPGKEIKYDEMRLVHGLLRCKSGCGTWNRDRNGSSNIYKIAYQAIHKLERPDYLCRTTSNQNTSTSVYKQNIHMV
jgi:transposase